VRLPYVATMRQSAAPPWGEDTWGPPAFRANFQVELKPTRTSTRTSAEEALRQGYLAAIPAYKRSVTLLGDPPHQ